MCKEVLWVEDEAAIRELIKYNLVKEGYNVRSVESGSAGLHDVRSDPSDLVILDLMLPDTSGNSYSYLAA